MKCRVFTTNLGWCDAMFIFDINTKFSEIKSLTSTSILTRNDYVGTYDFDKNFINFFDKKQIGNKLYFYRHSYDKDKENIFIKKEESKEKKTTTKTNIQDDGSFESLF
jgi:hypothetical protein